MKRGRVKNIAAYLIVHLEFDVTMLYEILFSTVSVWQLDVYFLSRMRSIQISVAEHVKQRIALFF